MKSFILIAMLAVTTALKVNTALKEHDPEILVQPNLHLYEAEHTYEANNTGKWSKERHKEKRIMKAELKAWIENEANKLEGVIIVDMLEKMKSVWRRTLGEPLPAKKLNWFRKRFEEVDADGNGKIKDDAEV
jgi:hypothetical protein